MGFRVKWFGFHDDSWHESDILNTKEEIKKFIEVLGSPEDMTTSIIDANTGTRIPFKDIK